MYIIVKINEFGDTWMGINSYALILNTNDKVNTILQRSSKQMVP